VDHADRVVWKDELLRALWSESFVEESNLTQHIFLLRKAFSRHESGTKIIETVPGRGYRFAAVIKEQQPATDRMVISASESITRITLEEKVDTSERLLGDSKSPSRCCPLPLESVVSIGLPVDLSSPWRFASQAGSAGNPGSTVRAVRRCRWCSIR
jgi:hypothetical protein